jgi:hypothetical protein
MDEFSAGVDFLRWLDQRAVLMADFITSAEANKLIA